MEVACSLDEFAQVLSEDGYINDDSYFDDTTDLPSMFRVFGSSDTVLDSPESFPESPCSDEDIARVLEITQMSSPSLLESCISDSFVHLPTTHSDVNLDASNVSVTKTRDPCITNAVLHDDFSNKTTANFSGPGRPAGSLDGFCLHSAIFNNSVSVNLNSIIDAKENYGVNPPYFDSTPSLSPVSEDDHIQHTPPPNYAEHKHQTDCCITNPNLDSECAQLSFEVIPGNEGDNNNHNNNNDNNNNNSIHVEIEASNSQSISSAQRRKRKRKSYSKSSKSRKGKSKKPNPSPQPKPKPKKPKISNDSNEVKSSRRANTPSIKEPCSSQTTQSEESNPVEQLVMTNKELDSSDCQTASNQKEGTTLRRSTRSTRNTENYNFRLSSLVKRVETERRQQEPKQPKGKAKPPPLSKYRRRTANARERDRMKEINDAYDMLKLSLPVVEDESKQKMTKFTILKLALNYISALRDMLGYDSLSSSDEREILDLDLDSFTKTSNISDTASDTEGSMNTDNMVTSDSHNSTNPSPKVDAESSLSPISKFSSTKGDDST